MRTEIHVWHLEITDATKIPQPNEQRPYRIERVENATPEFARYLYVAVGAPWTWYMRLRWQHSDWQKRFSNEQVSLWVAYHDGAPIGYFELEQQPGQSVEIVLFGLVPDQIGRGLGKQFLEDAIATAWRLGGHRVWLHTCSLDHKNALDNYRSRGFRVFREENVVDDIPDDPIQPWPHANR